jgi:hypothetical protein
MKVFMICTLHKILLKLGNRGLCDKPDVQRCPVGACRFKDFSLQLSFPFTE